MGYLKSGISRCVAVLSACGVVTVSAVTFATLDKNVIQPCAVMPPENAKVISAVSDKETSEQIGDITTVLTTSAVKETAKNSQTEAVKAVKTCKKRNNKVSFRNSFEIRERNDLCNITEASVSDRSAERDFR